MQNNRNFVLRVTRNENMIVPRPSRDVFGFSYRAKRLAVAQRVVEGPLPDIKFFHIGRSK